MARKRTRTRRKRSAPAAIVVRQASPVVVARRRRAPARVIVGRVRRARTRSGGGGGGGRVVKQLVSSALSMGSAAAYGALVAKGKLPGRFGPVESATAIGIGLSVVPLVLKGTVGRVIGDVGVGIGSVAAYRLATGLKVWQSAGEWDEEDD